MSGYDNHGSLYRVQTKNAQSRDAVKAFLKLESKPPGDKANGFYIGPRPEMITSWSSNVVSILHESGINDVISVERYRWVPQDSKETYDDLTEIKFAATADLSSIFEAQSQQFISDGLVDDIKKYSDEHGLNFDDVDVKFYMNLFGAELKRKPTKAELHDLANSNSEHSRHHLFRARFRFDSKHGPALTERSMMDLVQLTLNDNNRGNSLVAFCDNASAIRGVSTQHLIPVQPGQPGQLLPKSITTHISFTAETHNFPTGIAPFEGATTGVGGRIRDTQAIGRGGMFVAGTAGYCVGPLNSDRFDRISPIDMLLRASDGASDYGNKIGEPIIQGFCRANRLQPTNSKDNGAEWVKPIMFSGGIGHVYDQHLYKLKPEVGWKIVRVGGPTYRLGIGGGAASSVSQTDQSINRLLSAVQRGDAQTENRMDAWLRACVNMLDGNPVLSVHDQGAGGMANVTKEILEGVGGVVDLKRVTLGDQTLSNAEIWVSESQEQITTLIHPDHIAGVKAIAFRERVHLDVIGEVTDSGRIVVTGTESECVVNLPLKGINPPVKLYDFVSDVEAKVDEFPSGSGSYLLLTERNLMSTLSSVDVGSKRFLTNKVDRSVGGLIAQQQCVGPFQTPLSNVAVIANSLIDPNDFTGAATAIGERMMSVGRRWIQFTIFEMLTNLIWASITDLKDVKCSGNWMWPAKTAAEKQRMYNAARQVHEVLTGLGIAIDGGKDSVSMSAQLKSGEVVNSPPTFVISGYAPCTDIRLTVRPGFQRIGSHVLLIAPDSVFMDHSTRWNDWMKNCFTAVQTLIKERKILSGHDVSDGGIMTALCEMCFAAELSISGNTIGVQLHRNNEQSVKWLKDTPAILLEVATADISYVLQILDGLSVKEIGYTISDAMIRGIYVASELGNDDLIKMDLSVQKLRKVWEETATELEKMQTKNGDWANQELNWLVDSHLPTADRLPMGCWNVKDWTKIYHEPSSLKPKVAVVRGEGTNGHREMAAMLYCAGFTVYDITSSDLTDGRVTSLNGFRGLVFPGGFTYSDVLGSAAGWEAVLTRNTKANQIVQEFRARPDTFVFGVCNGCQLLARLGWVGEDVSLAQNLSGRFESRFVTVNLESDTFWTKDMNYSSLGVWVSHGEGRFVNATKNAVMTYANPFNDATALSTRYPLNPNGSEDGVAAVTSDDGRVLAMMPHPERCYRSWQLPWCPPEWKGGFEKSNHFTPWIKMFQNAVEWCADANLKK